MSPLTPESTTPWTTFSTAGFDIGGEDQISFLRKEFPTEPVAEPGIREFQAGWEQFLKETRIRIGTLLKSDNVSFLLGAGASKDAGGVLLSKIPLEVEERLLVQGIKGNAIRGWLRVFYLAASELGGGADIAERSAILARMGGIRSATPLAVNYEALLSQLYRWRSAMGESGGRILIEPTPKQWISSRDLNECLARTKQELVKACTLPTSEIGKEGVVRHAALLRKSLTRPLSLKRGNFFTLNYDTLIEQAADGEGVVVIDGFVGAGCRVFRPESFDYDMYFPAETTEGRVHRLDRVIHLYKLHGSVSWKAEPGDWINPYGITCQASIDENESALIYPTPTKFGETLGMPYSEMFRRFAVTIVRPQSSLFVLGYGFGDDHVNAIIRQALSIPSFSLVIVDPYAPLPDGNGSPFVARLRAQKDRRVWVISGDPFGTFSGFVTSLLPDLRDQEIQRKVMETVKAIARRERPTDSEA